MWKNSMKDIHSSVWKFTRLNFKWACLVIDIARIESQFKTSYTYENDTRKLKHGLTSEEKTQQHKIKTCTH